MAVTYGFYNSLNGDRKYYAEQMSSIFNGIITDGVFSSIGDALMTVAGSATSMQVIVKTGRAWFNGTWTQNDALLPLDISAADVSLVRIDAVVLEVNTSDSVRANSIKIVKGTASANPQKPMLTNENLVHQYALAYVTVPAGATSISASNIEVNVGKTGCPFITSVLQQADITDVFNQWETEFNEWFANVKSSLSGDVAANLQRQIIEVKDSIITDDTAKIFDPAFTNPTGEDVFKWLSEYNKHWWREFVQTNGYYKLGENASFDDAIQHIQSYVDIVKSITIDSLTGKIQPKDIKHIVLSSSGSTSSQRSLDFCNQIIAEAPCWLYHVSIASSKYSAADISTVYNTFYYIPAGATAGTSVRSKTTLYAYWDSDSGYLGFGINGYQDVSYAAVPQPKIPNVIFVDGTVTDPVISQTLSKTKDEKVVTKKENLQVFNSETASYFPILVNSGAPTRVDAIYYSESLQVDSDNILQLVSPLRMTVWNDDKISGMSFSSLKGKYVQAGQFNRTSNANYSRTDPIYYVPEDYADFPDITTDPDPYSISVPIIYFDHTIGSKTVTQYLGQPFQNFSLMPKFMTGYYEGNGKKGGTDSVKINSNFRPKLVLIRSAEDRSNESIIWFSGSNYAYDGASYVACQEGDDSFEFYPDSNARCNVLRRTYCYFIIG